MTPVAPVVTPLSAERLEAIKTWRGLTGAIGGSLAEDWRRLGPQKMDAEIQVGTLLIVIVKGKQRKYVCTEAEPYTRKKDGEEIILYTWNACDD